MDVEVEVVVVAVAAVDVKVCGGGRVCVTGRIEERFGG